MHLPSNKNNMNRFQSSLRWFLWVTSLLKAIVSRVCRLFLGSPFFSRRTGFWMQRISPAVLWVWTQRCISLPHRTDMTDSHIYQQLHKFGIATLRWLAPGGDSWPMRNFIFLIYLKTALRIAETGEPKTHDCWGAASDTPIYIFYNI